MSGLMLWQSRILTGALALTAIGCATDRAHYQYQRTVPGADGTVYVQAVKIQPKLFIFSSSSPVVLNCKLRGEDLRCDRELDISIDKRYWQQPGYFQKDAQP